MKQIERSRIVRAQIACQNRASISLPGVSFDHLAPVLRQQKIARFHVAQREQTKHRDLVTRAGATVRETPCPMR